MLVIFLVFICFFFLLISCIMDIFKKSSCIFFKFCCIFVLSLKDFKWTFVDFTVFPNSHTWAFLCMCLVLKVECWAELGLFHDHNFTLKYHVHNSIALYMQPYWKFYRLIFEGKNGLKVNFELKLCSFNWREATHFYNKTKYLTQRIWSQIV